MNELANISGLTIQPKEITLSVVDTATKMGELAYKSGIFKAPKAEAAAMIMLKGYELGFPMTAAAEFIQIIEGTVGLTPRGALAIMKAHPEIIRSVELEDLEKDGQYYGCRCTITRIENGRDVPHSQQFTLDDAAAAGLIKEKSGWEKYPRNMCRWRALGFAADVACPDLLSGLTGIMKMPEILSNEEVRSFHDTERIEPSVIEVIDTPKQVTLSELLNRFEPEQILAVNNGAMPRNSDECAKIAEILGAN